MTILLLVIAACGQNGSATPHQEEINQARETLKQSWEAIGSLKIKEYVYIADALVQEIEFLQSVGGRRSMVQTGIQGGVRKTVVNFREDGKRHSTIQPSNDPGDGAAPLVSVDPQHSTDARYEGPMFSTLWLLMPRGYPLWKLMASPDGWEAGRDERGRFVRTRLNINGIGSVLFELEPAHNWLPRRIATPGDDFVIEVDEFAKKDGSWYPTRGRESFSAFTGSGRTERRFEVVEFEINRRVSESKFRLDSMPKGTIVRDHVSNKSSIVGYRSFDDYERERSSSESSPPPDQPRLEIARRSWASLWSYSLGIFSFFLIVMGIILRSRTHRVESSGHHEEGRPSGVAT